MPTSNCVQCGRMTNSVCSNWIWDHSMDGPNGCYAAFDPDTRTWSRGCRYDQADPYQKQAADYLILTQPHRQDPAAPNNKEDASYNES